MDREKVIKGLEHCRLVCEGVSHNPCNGCPYQGNIDCADRLKTDTLELLKEDCHNCKLECLLQKYDELKEKYDALLKEQEAVVRCKDCAYALFKEGMVLPGNIVCTKPFTERWQAVKPDNWFCADGQRFGNPEQL